MPRENSSQVIYAITYHGFTSSATKHKFDKKFATHKVWKEQGFTHDTSEPDYHLEKVMHDIVESHNWPNFYDQPGSTNISCDTEIAKGATHEQCKAITTRSGKSLNTPNKSNQGEETVAKPNAAAVPDNSAQADTPASVGEDHEIPTESDEVDPTVATPHIKLPRTDTLEDTRSPPPFPQRLKKHKQEYQFKKFFDITKTCKKA
ncbi:hypothetical protein GQ457_18G011050 [Hibiscus cannabinus]